MKEAPEGPKFENSYFLRFCDIHGISVSMPLLLEVIPEMPKIRIILGQFFFFLNLEEFSKYLVNSVSFILVITIIAAGKIVS